MAYSSSNDAYGSGTLRHRGLATPQGSPNPEAAAQSPSLVLSADHEVSGRLLDASRDRAQIGASARFSATHSRLSSWNVSSTRSVL